MQDTVFTSLKTPHLVLYLICRVSHNLRFYDFKDEAELLDKR